MIVENWMTPAPVVLPPETGLLEIRALFRHNTSRYVPIVDDGALVGVVSDRDVLEAISPLLDAPGESHREATLRTAADIMTPNPITVGPQTSMVEAAKRMIEAEASALIVVSRSGALVGILTASDVLRASSVA